jgi:hypothetical protein
MLHYVMAFGRLNLGFIRGLQQQHYELFHSCPATEINVSMVCCFIHDLQRKRGMLFYLCPAKAAL